MKWNFLENRSYIDSKRVLVSAFGNTKIYSSNPIPVVSKPSVLLFRRKKNSYSHNNTCKLIFLLGLSALVHFSFCKGMTVHKFINFSFQLIYIYACPIHVSQCLAIKLSLSKYFAMRLAAS